MFFRCFKISSVLIALSLITGLSASAQSLTERNWFFGNSDQYLRFSKDGDSLMLRTGKGFPLGSGGGVTVSEPTTGDLLFYTDGNILLDAGNSVVSNSLDGDGNINQAATVFANQDGSFTLFTNDGLNGTNGIRTTLVNKTIAPNSGNTTQLNAPQLVLSNQNAITSLTNPTDAMLIIKTRRGRDYLITQNRLNDSILVSTLTPNGIISQTTQYGIFNTSTPSFDISNLSFHQDSSLLALSSNELNRNIVVCHVVDSTGEIVFASSIRNSSNGDDGGISIYDMEWSPDGTKLYWSRFGDNSTNVAGIYQFDLNDPDSIARRVINNTLFRSYGLKLGPDSTIYHLYQNTNGGDILLGGIENPNAAAPELTYNETVLEANDFEGRQFPVTANSVFSNFTELSFTEEGTCIATNTADNNNATTFIANIEPTPTSVHWDFGDTEASNAYAPVHTYMSGGSYTVSMTVTLNDSTETETITRIVNITESDVMLDIGQDTTICPGEEVEMDATIEGAISYAWNVDTTSSMITVDSAGTYWVAVTLDNGCTIYDQRSVTVYGDTTRAGTIWYFGERAGLDFRLGSPPTALVDENIMSSIEGAAVMLDEEEDLQFYTNGQTVWNKDHEVMLNGDNIGGDPESTQSALIVKASRGEDATQYYIFTTSPSETGGAFALKYSMVDMRQDSAKGEVVQKDMLLLDNSTEKITATGVGDDDIWLIAHEYGNSVYRAYPVTTEGIGAPVLSDIGSPHSFDNLESAKGYLKFSVEAGSIAAAIPEPDNVVEILSFDIQTGEISSPVSISMGESSQVYGVEFSANGDKLYASTNSVAGGGTGSALIQYDLDSLRGLNPVQDISDSKSVISTDAGTNYGALQRGPRGSIYMAVANSSTIGLISNPNEDPDEIGFSINGVDLGGRTSNLGLPNFTQDVSSSPSGPAMTVTDACLGTEAIFAGNGTSDIDEYFWTFGDGESASVMDTTHVYAIAQMYDVSLRITNRCGYDSTLFQQITVDSLPVASMLPPNDFLCSSESLTLEAIPIDQATDLFFNWSTGETTRTIEISVVGNYQVTISDSTGCSANPATANIIDGRPFLEIGEDIFACQNETLPDLDDGNSPPKIREWFIDDSSTGNVTSSQAINTTTAGAFEYKVILEDEISGCISIDSILVTINDTPNGIFSSDSTSGCGNADGSIAFTLDQTNGEAFNYAINGGGQTTYTAPVINAGLAAGNYTLIVSNVASGCDTTVVLPVSDRMPNFSFSLNQIGRCEEDPLDIEVDLTVFRDDTTIVDFTISNDVGLNISDSALLDVDDDFNIIPELSPANLPITAIRYDVVVVHNGCTLANSIFIETDPLVQLNYNPMQNYCIGDGESQDITFETVNADTALSYQWFLSGNTGVIDSDSVLTLFNTQAGTYVVESTPPLSASLCPASDTIEVAFFVKPEVTIDSIGDPCEGEVMLSADFGTPPADFILADYNYKWKSSPTDSIIGAQQITVTETANYELTAFNSITSCIAEASRVINVFTPIIAVLDVDQSCDDDPSVTLTGISNITTAVSSIWQRDGAPLDNDNNNTLQVEESGLYSFIVTDNVTSCVGSDSSDIVIMPLVLPNNVLLPTEVFICSLDPLNGSFTYSNLPTEFSYTWRLSNDNTVVSRSNPFTVTSGGTYSVEITNGFDCLEFVSRVQDNCLPRIVAPNAFSPDGNGINDLFSVLSNPYVSDFKIYIYNRWGELIFQSENMDFEWNGQLKGNGMELPVGTYAYKMEFKSSLAPNVGVIEQRGGVALIK